MRKLKISETIKAITDWILKLTNEAKSPNIVVGLSGGIDSSVTAALCMNAVGKERITAYALPCESNPGDLSDANLVANHLNIKLIVVDLTSTFNEFIAKTRNLISASKAAIVNLKTRLRMATLYFAAQSIDNCLVAGTGNRVEIAIGYFTNYSDQITSKRILNEMTNSIEYA